MKYNRELQEINTENKAYLLGLFYSDGSISRTKNTIKYSINLLLKDKELIEDIHTIFPFFNISCYKEKYNYLRSGFKSLYNDLLNNGCLPQKSSTNRDLLRLPLLDDSLIRHFIRGYFDGDGGCTLTKGILKEQKRVYIYSASKYLIKDFKDYLDNKNIKSSIATSPIRENSILVYKLTIRTESYRLFYNFLYEDSELYMKRKYNLFTKILSTNLLIRKPTPNCKFCNSSHVVCNGYNYYKEKRQNYLCKDCNRHFSAPLSSNIQSGGDELLED